MAAGVPDGFGSRWRTVRGLRLHALESAGGQGAPVVLLPGLVTASRAMVPLARALAWDAARQYLAARAPDHDVTFGEDRLFR